MLRILEYVIRYPQIHDKAGEKWSNEEDLMLKKLYEKSNKSIADISMIHGRTIPGIVARIKKKGLYRKTETIVAKAMNCIDNHLSIEPKESEDSKKFQESKDTSRSCESDTSRSYEFETTACAFSSNESAQLVTKNNLRHRSRSQGIKTRIIVHTHT
jgi:hypothetical protein